MAAVNFDHLTWFLRLEKKLPNVLNSWAPNYSEGCHMCYCNSDNRTKTSALINQEAFTESEFQYLCVKADCLRVPSNARRRHVELELSKFDSITASD